MRFRWKLETPEEQQKFLADVLYWTNPGTPPFDDECSGLSISAYMMRMPDGRLVRCASARDEICQPIEGEDDE